METQTRTQTLDTRASGDRTVEVSFSSEAPIVVDGREEVLDHSPGSVDLSRMHGGAAVLFEHDRERQIGVVVRAWIDSATRKGRAIIKFSSNPLADEVYRDVRDGIRKLVSVGFSILSKPIATARGVRIPKWQPHEISIVSVPADISVGVGRSAKINSGNYKMDTEQENTALTEDQVIEVTELAREHDLDASDLIRRRTTPNELMRSILAQNRRSADTNRTQKEFAEGSTGFRQVLPGGRLGGRPGEFRHDDENRYSLVRALRLLSEGKTVDGLEGETHSELQKASPEAARGFMVPLNLGRRSLTATGTTSTAGDQGGVTVQNDVGGMIDILRNSLQTRALGATVLTGLQGNLNLPRVTAAASASWKSESADLDASNATFGQLGLSPHRLGTYTEISKQLLIQNSPDIERWVRQDLALAIANAWETAAISGTGSSGQPTGILNTAGIGSVAGGTNGAVPTWANIVGLESLVAGANAATGSLGYLTNSKARGKLKTVLRNSSGTDATYIWPDDGKLNGYETGISNAVPSNLTKGSGTALSALIFGNWRDLILAQWGGGLDLMVNPYSKDIQGLVRILAATFVDVGIRHPASFAAMTDAVTV